MQTTSALDGDVEVPPASLAHREIYVHLVQVSPNSGELGPDADQERSYGDLHAWDNQRRGARGPHPRQGIGRISPARSIAETVSWIIDMSCSSGGSASSRANAPARSSFD